MPLKPSRADQNDRRNQQVSGIGKVDLIFYYVAHAYRGNHAVQHKGNAADDCSGNGVDQCSANAGLNERMIAP